MIHGHAYDNPGRYPIAYWFVVPLPKSQVTRFVVRLTRHVMTMSTDSFAWCVCWVLFGKVVVKEINKSLQTPETNGHHLVCRRM
jgi:hypothetical protein